MKQIIETTRAVLKNLGSLAIFAGLYALLLATLYGFIATKEAKIWQVLLTLFFAAGAPVIFFLLQAAIINSARQARIEWYATLRDSCKLALLALPLILMAFGIAYLLNRWQSHFPAPPLAPLPVVSASVPGNVGPPPLPPIHWPTVMFATARGLVFVITLPLVMIQLWVSVGKQDLLALVRSGPRTLLKSLGQTLAQAFATQSVLIYSLGLIVFALIPYVLLFGRVSLNGTWREVGVFSVRLALVFAFTLFGWVLTLSTFARANNDLPPVEPAPAEGASTEGEPKPLGSTEMVA